MRTALIQLIVIGSSWIWGASVTLGQVEAGNPGPWGRLNFRPIILEPPLKEVVVGDRFAGPIIWDFPERSVADLVAKLTELGFSRDEIESLKDQRWEIGPDGIRIYPSKAFVEAMDMPKRKATYNYLWDRGIEKRSITIERNEISFLDLQDFPPFVEEYFRRFSFVQGKGLVFSDSQLIAHRLDSNEEQARYIKRACRTRGMIVNLELDADSDLEALANYWSLPATAGSVLPLLRSAVQQGPGTFELDISRLLPPLARTYLNSYVQPEDIVRTDLPDCYWTALNFSRQQPSRRALDFDGIAYYLNSDYVSVVAPHRFGDVMALLDQNGEFEHAYVYIADDIVFTKNGRSALYPWILMRESDMMVRYSDKEVVRVGFRSKEIEAP